MADIFDPNGPGANLMNFGFSTMAAAATPGIPTLSALGAGGQGMNAAALQQAQMQNIRAEAEGKKLQNQLIPYQMNLLQNQSKLIGSLADDEGGNTNQPAPAAPPSGAAGQGWQPTAGVSLPVQQPTNARANGNISQKPINNPGNLRPVGSSSGFMAYSTPQDGMTALREDLLAKINGSPSMQGKQPTLRNLISVYAPSKENDTASYVRNVSQGSGIDPDQPLSAADVDKIMPFMIRQEGNSGALTPFQQRRQQISSGNSPVPIPKPSKREMAMGFLGMPQLASEQYKAETAGPVAAAQEAAKTAEAGAQEQAKETGKNIAESQKQLAAINSSIDTQIDNLKTLKKLSKRMPNRGPADTEVWLSKHVGNQDMSSAFADFNTMNKQMFVNGLMGAIPAGSRLDIPIVKSLQAAKEVDPYTDAKSRDAVIDRHIETLKQAKENAQKNYRELSGDNSQEIEAPQPAAQMIHFNDLPD